MMPPATDVPITEPAMDWWSAATNEDMMRIVAPVAAPSAVVTNSTRVALRSAAVCVASCTSISIMGADAASKAREYTAPTNAHLLASWASMHPAQRSSPATWPAAPRSPLHRKRRRAGGAPREPLTEVVPVLHKRARKVGRSRRLPAIAAFVRRMVSETLPPVAEMQQWPACTPCALLALALAHAPPTSRPLDRAVVDSLDLSMLDEARLRRVAELLRSMRAGGAPLVNMLQRTFPAAAAPVSAPSADNFGRARVCDSPGRAVDAAVSRLGRRRARRPVLEEEDDDDKGGVEEDEEDREWGWHGVGASPWPPRKHAATAPATVRRAPGPENAATAALGEAWKNALAPVPRGASRPLRLCDAPL